MKPDRTLTLLTQALLNNGLDYRVTLRSNTTVELLDNLTGAILGTNTSETLEEALTSVIGQVLGRVQTYPERLSVL